MKILQVNSEGYMPVGEIFPFGDHFYLISEEFVDVVIKMLQDWAATLGECKSSPNDHHLASSHVHWYIHDVTPFPETQLKLPTSQVRK